MGDGQTAITIGTNNVQVIVYVNVNREDLETCLREIATSTRLARIEVSDEIEVEPPIGGMHQPSLFSQRYVPLPSVGVRSGLVIRGTVEPTPSESTGTGNHTPNS